MEETPGPVSHLGSAGFIPAEDWIVQIYLFSWMIGWQIPSQTSRLKAVEQGALADGMKYSWPALRPLPTASIIRLYTYPVGVRGLPS